MSENDTEKVATPTTPKVDLASIRLEDDIEMGLSSNEIEILVQRPATEWWVQVHPDESLTAMLGTIQLEREIYLVANRQLCRDLETSEESQFHHTHFYTAINSQHEIFLWPVKYPKRGGSNSWYESAKGVIEEAKHDWIRVKSNLGAGCYSSIQQGGAIKQPKWPEQLDFAELLGRGFAGRIIDDWQHPILKELRGEI